MNVNVIHPNLNPCGGGERLSLAVMKAVTELGAYFDITTYQNPDKSKLQQAFGHSFGETLQKAGNINILRSALDHSLKKKRQSKSYDITINTHVDGLPYFLDSYSKKIAFRIVIFPQL